MGELSCRERLVRTLQGDRVDRIPTFDIIHNIDLIEHVTEDKVTPANAEDLLCKTAGELLDLIRHFAPPDNLQPRIVRDETGFVYEYDWWTGHIVERPQFNSSVEIADSMKRDMDIIRECIEKKKICHIARQHVRLFDENYETIEEVKAEFKRVSEKLNGTVMLAPEDLGTMGMAAERYDETGWWYLYRDQPETAVQYMDALTEYQLCFIDNFADSSVSQFAQISLPVGTGSGLLYSPDWVRKEVIPREKQKVARWKEHGYYVLAFLDGYKWPVIDDFLGIGVDEIHPCEPYCQMDVGRLREKYPDLVLGQPIDCAGLLAFGQESEVEAAVVKAIEDAGKKKIIIGSTSEIHPRVKPENALRMYRTARDYVL